MYLSVCCLKSVCAQALPAAAVHGNGTEEKFLLFKMFTLTKSNPTFKKELQYFSIFVAQLYLKKIFLKDLVLSLDTVKSSQMIYMKA